MNTDICDVKLTTLSHDGRAIGRLLADDETQKLVIFVQGALPGQRVRAKIIKQKKSFAEAICLEILEDSPESRPAPCAHAEKCGGCALQTMPYASQLYWKKTIVHEAMARIAKLSAEELNNIQDIIPSPQQWGYRNKMEFAFGHDLHNESQLMLGLRAKASHNIVNVPHCMLMPEHCMQAIEVLRKKCQQLQLSAWNENNNGILRHAVLRCTQEGAIHLCLITARTSKNLRKDLAILGQELMDSIPQLTGFVHQERYSRSMFAEGEKLITELGQKVLYQKLGNINYTFGHDAFFQINRAAAEKLTALILSMLPPASAEALPCIWDICCGVGAPGLSLAHAASALYGVEINPRAITMAKKNATSLGMEHCHYFAADAKTVLKNWPRPDLILLDPPRAGLHPSVIEEILNTTAKHIIYISCNPATLARDLTLLKAAYTLDKLVPLDFFPQSTHVESCALLSRHT